MFNSIKYNQAAFTLAETLITLAIFTTALTTTANIFMLTNRSARKTEALQQSQTDARFAMEVMAQQVRRGNIDYVYYGGSISSNPQSVLALLDVSGSHIQFKRVESAGRGIIQISQDGGTSWADITPTDISVLTLAFYISPATDPFIANPVSTQPPLVTITVSTANTTSEGASLAPLVLQTTVSSRQYLR